MKTISFYTLGCRLNQSETAVIEHTFKNGGYKIVDFEEPADIVVINTCTVTENGDTGTRRLVQKINRLNPQTKIALIGCQAQIQKEKLAGWPNVRWVVGNAVKTDLKSIIENSRDVSPYVSTVITPTISREPFTIPISGIDRHHTRANLKIQDGCNFFCSFCEIPFARGRARSRVFENVLSEAKTLVEAGHTEIILTGINLGTYSYKSYSLMDVIEAIEQIQGLKRIRISSIEPTTIPKKITEKMIPKGKLCRYLHVPLQSGSDRILKTMKRKYTIKAFHAFLEEVQGNVPDICLGTDILAGFPGESEEDFKKSYDYLQNAPINYCHVFSYSERHLAKSRLLSDKIDKRIIHERSKMLRDLGQRKRTLFYSPFLKTTQSVLFEEKKDDFWFGLTDHYLRVKVHSDLNLKNQLLPVHLEKLSDQNIEGRLIDHD